MIQAYADCSVDDPIYAVGYVIYRTQENEEQLLDTGTRVFNCERDTRDINWSVEKAEYYGAIIATRAALDYTHEPLQLHLDNADVVKNIKEEYDGWEDYFHHCLYSFLPRFEDYWVRLVHRKNNEAAHRQANTGLQIGREIQEGTL